MKFIIWDSKDGNPRTKDGGWVSGGLIGLVTLENVYLRAYGLRPEGSKPYEKLEVGECVAGVQFSLSGTTGSYDVYRVE